MEKTSTNIFDKESIDKQIINNLEEPVKHYIGVKFPSYTLMRHFKGTREFIISKIIYNKSEFDWEVESLSKIFNAKILKEAN